jgi:hypothetical protein
MDYKTTKLFVVVAFLLASCFGGEPFVPEFPVGEVEGYKPVYANDVDVSINVEPSRPLQNPGKIYVFHDYLLVSEHLQGIHVYDNSDPTKPQNIGFLRVAGNTDMAIKGYVLYVNHVSDLVALDIRDWASIKEISRVRQDGWVSKVPPGEGRYFECPDLAKGVVIGWTLETLNNPTCFR